MFNKMNYGVSKLWSWNLFWWKIEGCEPLNGLNVYKKTDPASSGFIVKIGKFLFRARYSKRTKKWHLEFHKTKIETYDGKA
jgi:hypothetical protein